MLNLAVSLAHMPIVLHYRELLGTACSTDALLDTRSSAFEHHRPLRENNSVHGIVWELIYSATDQNNSPQSHWWANQVRFDWNKKRKEISCPMTNVHIDFHIWTKLLKCMFSYRMTTNEASLTAFDLSEMKFRERDSLVEIFKHWRNFSDPSRFPMSKHW
jgi:hypothetical protein